jgi:hypothetical protein
MPLLTYLDDPPNGGRAVDWLCACVGDLLELLGKASAEFDGALSLARRYAADGGDPEEIEREAWGFWSRRLPEDASTTAVAQLLFALSRGDRSHSRDFLAACATPICLLEGLESRRGEVFDRVVAHFSSYAGGPDA